MQPVGDATTQNDRETPIGRDGSGPMAIVAPAADGLSPLLLKRFDPPAGGTLGRVRLAQRLWRLARLGLAILPGLAVAQTRAGAPPAAWVAAPEHAVLGERPRLGPEDGTGLLGALLDAVARAHQARVAGLRFDPTAVTWHAGYCRWLAPDLAPVDLPAGAGGWEARRAEDLLHLATALRSWLAEPPPAGHPLAMALAALESAGADPAAQTAAALAVLALPAPPLRVPAPAPFEARDAELAELGDALQLATGDRRLVCVQLEGTEGTFQEELFDALAAAWRAVGVVVLAGRCRGEDAVGAPLRDLAIQLAARRGGAPVGPLAGLSADAPPAVGLLPALSPAAARKRLFRALDDELRRARGQGPLVIALTGHEAADELTRAWVEHLATHDAGMPCLLVLAGAAMGADAEPHPRAELLIQGQPLTPDETASVARTLAGGGEIGDAHALWEATQGERPRVFRWVQRRLAGAPVTMPEGVRELLRAFATMGGTCELPALYALMGMPDAGFFELLERALDGGWLLERGGRLEFVVPADAQGVRDEMAPGDALRWHRRLAAVGALAPAERVRHALLGGPEGLAPVLAAAALRYMLAIGADRTAGALAQAALAQAAPDDPARELLARNLAYLALDRADVDAAALWLAELTAADDAIDPARDWLEGALLMGLGDGPGAEAALARAAATADDPADRGRIQALRAALAANGGEWARARALATDAIESRAAAADSHLRDVVDAEVRLVLARGLLADGPAAATKARLALSEALAAGEAVGHAGVACTAALTLADQASRRERFGEARDALQRAATWADAALGPAAHVALEAALAGTFANMGLWEPALRHAIAAGGAPATLRPDAWAPSPTPAAGAGSGSLAGSGGGPGAGLGPRPGGTGHLHRAPGTGPLPAEPAQPSGVELVARAVHAIASLYLGQLQGPVAALEDAVAAARASSDPARLLAAFAPLAHALNFLGRFVRAAGLAAEGRALAERLGEANAATDLGLVLADAVWRLGEHERAEGLYEEILAGTDPLDQPATVARALVGRARAQGLHGAFAAALAALADAWELADAAGIAGVQAEIAYWRGEMNLATGDGAAAAEAYGLSLARAEALGSPHSRALALAGLGAASADPAAAEAYGAQAAAFMALYLEQIPDGARREFLAWDERARALAAGAGAAEDEAPAAPPRPAPVPTAEAVGQVAAEDVLDLVAAGATPDALVARLNDAFRRISRAGRSMVFVVNEAGEPRLRDRRADPEALTILGPDTPVTGVVERVLATGRRVWVPDAPADPMTRDLPEVHERGVRGVLCVPITCADPEGGERVLGCLYGDRLTAWQGLGEGDLAAIARMARYAAVALRNAVLEEESRRKTQRLDLLGDLTRALSGTLDVDALLTLALRQVLAVTHGEHGYVFFGPDLVCRASLDREGRALPDVQVSRSVIARVTQDRQPLTILDVGQDRELQQKASLMIRNVRSVMCVPLVLDDALLGLIYVSSSTANKTFGRHDLDVMAAIAAQVALMLQNAQAYETIKDLNLGLEAKVLARTEELEVALRELTETQAQLLETEKLATVGTLAAGVAHEINNPLGAVLTNAQLLKLDLEDPEQLDSLALIEEGARRCMEIVQALLKYSKPPQASYQTLDVRAIVEDTLGMVERQRQLEGIVVETRLEDAPGVLGDAAELRQVVVQVLHNAADAIHERADRPTGTVRVALARELSGLVLTVADDGVGMQPDVLKRIFDPFFTTKNVGSGTGLGLSVCRRVIEKHGGKIQVASRPGEGTTVTILLPVP